MLYKRPYIVRKATPGGGKEVTIPPFCPMRPGDRVVVLTDGFLLVIPEGTEVDERLLRRAIKFSKEE